VIERLLTLAYWLALRVRDGWFWLFRPRTVGVRVLVYRQGRDGREVLLVRHRVGSHPWDLPGGGVEKGEPVGEAARREVREEAGTAVRVEGVHGIFDNFQRCRNDTVLVIVAAALGEPQPRRSLEIAEARFFPLDHLPERLSQGSRRCIEEWRRGVVGTLGAWWGSP
jgi:ADP-ribose pyrophosphatase YjhB (NUDIX family)